MSDRAKQRVFNFSPGPATLPLSVLEQIQRDILAYPGAGASILEISHRSPTMDDILDETEANLRLLLSIPDNYRVLFMQGGGRLQFSLVPLNLLYGRGTSAQYVLTGSWGKKAIDEARREGEVSLAWDGSGVDFCRVPTNEELDLDPLAAYIHYTSNETIQGVQFPAEPAVGEVPLVCDTSSDFLSRPIPIDRYGLLYACAQKNAGAAGLTAVIVRDDLLRTDGELHTMLDYGLYARQRSLVNTPPVFAIYILMLVTRWLMRDMGGLDAVATHNAAKASLLYEVLDSSDGFYSGHAEPASRSLMNVTFRLPDDETGAAFLSEARDAGLHQLKGHRSVGGVRASIYNAMPVAGVEALRDFMITFRGSR
ncbi:MAG: 3-phosphoserine/phosphohydroxythreonine transaminase [Acidobacteriota bacterium]|nr:3-phosphoserine/phosphohydroxythreonine transaminase [Acidobacteriota bacterium]